MQYLTDGTKRYIGNINCAYNELKLSEDDKYQYGCEFEFYIQPSLF